MAVSVICVPENGGVRLKTGMNSRFIPIGLTVIALLTVAGICPNLARAERQIWTVQDGDMLGVLAMRFDCTVDQLRAWNSLGGDTIRVGQELVVGDAGDDERREAATYRVRQGDTLGHIARRHGVSVSEIVSANAGLNPDRLRVGQRIRIGPRRYRLLHRIQTGETLARIARRYRVRVRDVQRWNRRVSAQRLPVGRNLVIFSEHRPSFSESVGSPNAGSLRRAERLQPHPSYQLRNRRVAWGTLETVTWIRQGFDTVARRHPDAPRVRVHDLSDRDGGRLGGHRSHQSGRDADIAFFQRRCGDAPCGFRRITPGYLIAGPQWTLFEQWLRRDRIEFIFMDYDLQAPLYREARRRGASQAQLRRWFQYPRGAEVPVGRIRHYPRHADHAHVRFVCPDTDEECR